MYETWLAEHVSGAVVIVSVSGESCDAPYPLDGGRIAPIDDFDLLIKVDQHFLILVKAIRQLQLKEDQ